MPKVLFTGIGLSVLTGDPSIPKTVNMLSGDIVLVNPAAIITASKVKASQCLFISLSIVVLVVLFN